MGGGSRLEWVVLRRMVEMVWCGGWWVLTREEGQLGRLVAVKGEREG